MTDLAEELDISPQAVSERLRRAHKQLVQESMAIGTRADASRKQ
jgi:predicted DNA binding protein